jgi:4-hydroxybenzoate polyprenyltransferase
LVTTWDFLRATHLEPSLAVTAATTALAVSAGLGARSGWVASSVLIGQFSLGWANDYLDRERDRAAGRVTKPLAAGQAPAAAVRMAALLGFPVALLLSLPLGPVPVLLHAGGLAMGHLHNLFLKSTALSPVPFALGFAAIPSFVDFAANHHFATLIVTLGAACLGAGVHFVNALRDLDADRAVGVNGLPQRVGLDWSTVFATLTLGLAAVFVAQPGFARPIVKAAVVLALLLAIGVAAAAELDRPWLAYRLMIAAAGAAVLTLLLSGT